MNSDTLYKINILLLLLALWCVPWWIYNRFIRTKDFHPMGRQVLHTPRWMSCGIPYVSHNPKKNNCENVKFDGWTIGHILIYFTIGMVLPGYLVPIIALSILCEAFEYAVGWRARWIIDPLANLVGYLLGTLFYLNLRGYKFLTKSTNTTLFLTASLLIILFLNRPSMIPRGNEFY